MQQFHVISVWLQDPMAGLGDLIRGTMHLCELSQKFNFKLTVDMQFHPVSKYVMAPVHESREYVLQNKHKIHNFINGDKNHLLRVIQTAMRAGQTEPMLIFTNINDHMNVIPTAHSRGFIRDILMPTPEFQTEFNAMCKLHNINCTNKNHTIIHFRVGDDDLVNHIINLSKYKECLRVLDTHTVSGLMDDTSYIISDSYWFKHFLRKVRPHLAGRVLVTKPIHLSHSHDDGKHDELVADTMFDFYLLITAKVIKTYSSYTWVSGFVRWVSHAFNVPLVNLNYEVGYNQMKLFDSRLQSAPATAMFSFANIRPSPTPTRTTNVITTLTRTPKLTRTTNATPKLTRTTKTFTMTNTKTMPTTSVRAFIPLRLLN